MKPYMIQLIKVDKSVPEIRISEGFKKKIVEAVQEGKCPLAVMPYGYQLKVSNPPFYWTKYLNPKTLLRKIFA